MNKQKRSVIKTWSKAVIKSVYFIIPFAITGGILISLSYLVDVVTGQNAIYGLGSVNPAAVILKSIGVLTFSLMLPVLSSVIAVEISNRGAFMAGLIGGYLAQNGATLSLPYGDSTSVSGFIGAIFAGIVTGVTYNTMSKLLSKLKKAENQTVKNFILPFISLTTVSIIMLSINPLIGLLNTALSAGLMMLSSASPVLFGAVLGTMTAIDLGGAFNKAAFIFATAAIASGEYTAMAAVTAAGMTIPLSIALCSAIFKVKFSKKEAKLAKSNLLFGLCFITEGAIPIAAKEPARVIPAITSGAAISGALSAGFGCTLIAPYGGIFVIPIVGKPLLFLLSVFTGTLIGATVLGIFKKEPKIRYTQTVPVKTETSET